jgi:hypothetical protein
MLYSHILTLPLEWSRGQELHSCLLTASQKAVWRKILGEIVGRHVGSLDMDRSNNSKKSSFPDIGHGPGELDTLLVCLGIDAEIDSGRVVIVDWCRPRLEAAKFPQLVSHALHMLNSNHDCLRLSITG